MASVSSPTGLFSGDGRLYAFVPYTLSLRLRGHADTKQAYFIAISTSAGKEWKFVDAESITEQNIRLIIPSYANAISCRQWYIPPA